MQGLTNFTINPRFITVKTSLYFLLYYFCFEKQQLLKQKPRKKCCGGKEYNKTSD